jgi:hypothetical protein
MCPSGQFACPDSAGKRLWPATLDISLRTVCAFGPYQIGRNLVLERSEVQSECTEAIQKYYEDLPMNNFKETIGYFIAEIRDLESAESATNPPQDIPLSFRFAIDLDSNKPDVISALNAFLNIGCFPVAVLWRDLRSGKVSVGYPDSIPV